MRYISNFSEISHSDASVAGGKGASLGEMTQAGIPVPPGFVVLTKAFDQFLNETDVIQEVDVQLNKVNHEDMNSVNHASEVLKGLIHRTEFPGEIVEEIQTSFSELGAEFVAVRSSATAEDGATSSWAGELDTFLNTTEETLLENVKKCWASLFTPRAIFYRFENGFQESYVSVAVVVQKMVQSEVSGVAFSVHPVTKDKTRMIIEAGWGLGESVVSGSITPDSYVVDKNDWSLVDINIARQEKGLYRDASGGNYWEEIESEKQQAQKLSGTNIIVLAKLLKNIEDHYGFPCDTEWAMEGDEFFITQSRPITTLS